jgi:hypothetical protein
MVGGVEEAAGLAGEAVERALLRKRIDVALDRERARESEVRLNLAQRRRDAVLLLVGLDEIEDFLLTGGEGLGHDVFK